MPGVLVLCATPIGNLGDVSDRLRDALRSADVVFAEDTRRAATLLQTVEARPPVRSFFVGNEAERSPELARRLAAGERVVLVTDAGTPGVADPGVVAVRAAESVGATVTIVPGPSAVTAALAVAGLGADRFVFEGFLPRKGTDRQLRLVALAAETRTAVFFTTGERIQRDMADLVAATGPDRRVVVARELTKLHEEVWRGSTGEAADHWKEGRGEFTVVVEGAQPVVGDLATAIGEVESLLEAGVSLRDATRQVAATRDVRRKDLYEAVVARAQDN